MKTFRTSLDIIVALTILSFGLCVVLAVGQSGTARNNNSNRNTRAPQQRPTPKRRPTPQTKAVANKTKADASQEAAFWDRIKLSNDPEDFRLYLAKYPNGRFVIEANSRLNKLEKAELMSTPAGVTREDKEAKKPPTPGSTRTNQIGMAFVYVGPGEFRMGSKNGEKDEVPVHQVTIKEGFYMGRFEVTQSEYYSVMGKHPSHFQGGDMRKQPVEQVSWDDVQAFLSILNGWHDGFYYRLPTEAEWEYACRADTSGDYAGDLNLMAWYQHNSEGHTQPVGSKHPNAFGLYDMHGNVWEWCQDNGRNNYDGAPVDGSPWLIGGETTRMVRGGSYDDTAQACRSARRKGLPQDKGSITVGFRVVAVPVQTQ